MILKIGEIWGRKSEKFHEIYLLFVPKCPLCHGAHRTPQRHSWMWKKCKWAQRNVVERSERSAVLSSRSRGWSRIELWTSFLSSGSRLSSAVAWLLDQVAFYRGHLGTKSSRYYVEIYCFKNCSTVKLYKTQKMAANQVNFMKLFWFSTLNFSNF